MSRAFIKEDAYVPEPEKIHEFRVYAGRSRFELEPEVLFSSENLAEVLVWAREQLGYHQIRDSAGTLLAEVDAVAA
jgi:hypothetical protein